MAFDLKEIARKVREAGRAMGPEGFASMAIYTPFHEKEPYKNVRLERDLSYGPDERNRLDVFSAPDARQGDDRDVLMFVHGGGFTGGSKNTPGSPYNDNVPLWAMRSGLVGVNMTYRLAPQHKWPSGIEDIAGAVDWVRKNIRARGGNPERVFVHGVSAGASHVGMYVSHSHVVGGPPIAGAILQSGCYDFTHDGLGSPPGENQAAYLGTDQSKLAERAALNGLVETKTACLYALTEMDPGTFQGYTLRLIKAYAARRGQWPSFVYLRGHNHFTGTIALNTADDYFGQQILAFMDSTKD
ncbi:MAG TPA: alpha/beta hydrolase [Alphaproteobacteria bacterium]|nr:alpha/beta hydrolase [Alphaproteobacteria bacterium]